MRAALFVTLLIATAASAQERRFALAIGENRGLGNEEALRFAERDAARVKATLVEVGGFAEADVTVLAGADADQVRAALTSLRERVGGQADRLYLYVSSHASDGALHLQGTTLPLQELVDFLKRAPVKVGVLIVDACQSGAVTKVKGLKPVSGPVTRLEATGVEGRVLISASGADEYAQESEALGGSTFTHYLLTALRGAGDASRDGKVTLDEAYGWAWARTIEATFSTRGGVQRPGYSVDLRGSGQLVMSEPVKATAQLVLDVTPPGRWLIVSEDTGAVAADLEKAEGPLPLALAPGAYRVQLRTRDSVLERRVQVPASGTARVSGEDLERASLIRVARKGGEEITLHLSAGGGATSGLVTGLAVQPTAGVRLRRDGYLAAFLNEVNFDFTFRQGTPLQQSFAQLEFELRAGLGHRFAWDAGSLSLALELGPLLVHQSQLPDQSTRTSLGLVGALALEGRVHLFGPLELSLTAIGGGAMVRKLAGIALVPRLSLSAGLGVTF
ncbi:MAG: caspase family protein [Myxococcaceae bacterium]